MKSNYIFLTTLITDNKSALVHVSVKKIKPESCAAFKDCLFGTEMVTSLQLCSMDKDKQESGYYHVEYEIALCESTGERKDDFPCCNISCKPEVHVCQKDVKADDESMTSVAQVEENAVAGVTSPEGQDEEVQEEEVKIE